MARVRRVAVEGGCCLERGRREERTRGEDLCLRRLVPRRRVSWLQITHIHTWISRAASSFRSAAGELRCRRCPPCFCPSRPRSVVVVHSELAVSVWRQHHSGWRVTSARGPVTAATHHDIPVSLALRQPYLAHRRQAGYTWNLLDVDEGFPAPAPARLSYFSEGRKPSCLPVGWRGASHSRDRSSPASGRLTPS